MTNETAKKEFEQVVIDGMLAPSEVLNYVPLWPLYVNMLAAVFCFGFSAYYHTGRIISEKWFKFLLRLDMSGIAFLIAGSFSPMIDYIYACHSVVAYRRPFLTTIYILSGAALLILLIHVGRIGVPVFATLGIFSPVPLYYIWSKPSSLDMDFLMYTAGETEWPYMIGALFYIFGGVFLVSKLPERVCRVRFDLVGASH